ncbi:D-alanyl-D-alanine carboxypeptidase [Thioalkalivibrio nitratireducens DSM 14787]|uniref:serine-type D-Ala-D-Ala carboxypeptidase n=2 Tax=Thioalkalivibrio nitratireducens TaxID=186931 RepID=L0DZN9_THIND|nr:D-alanyl-D-alanine carboxypeptidase family protein [Thioalkalivibrio nitratireducens]AGA33856.1 D-alanyl-D-alanine carboxypeptidase [Thioalkalivibrio nitratireducens DSM 14787]
MPRSLILMNKHLLALLGSLLLIVASVPQLGAQPLPTPGPATASLGVIPQPPSDITAKSYILIDFDSGLPLASLDPDMEREPASLTKLMTAYVVFSEIRAGKIGLEDQVTISERAWRTGMDGASRMFIEVGERVAVEDLLRGMIVQSGNDASTALAERVAGSEGAFVDLMNAQARALGMHRSYFANPHGLPGHEAQYTTPADMARLARALIRDFPELYGYYSEKSFTYNDINQSNRNLLLWRDESFDGLKTGWTSAAGYNLVSSAKRNDRRLIAVVMGIDAPNHQRGGIIRANESQALINWGMRFFESRKLFEGGTVLNEPRLYKGASTTVEAGLAEPFWVVLPQGQGERLQATMELHGPHMAPIEAGDTVGEVRVTLGGETLGRQPLVALETVEAGGIFRWLWDSTVLAIRSAWPL